jgi:hypothetical protein
MNITVTREDIKHGQRRDPEHCAIARALVRAGLDHFGVMGPSVMVADGWGRLTSLRLPEEVSDWIFDFDAGNPVGPLRFKLHLPEPTPEQKSRTARKTGPLPIPAEALTPLVLDLQFVTLKPVESAKRSTRAPKAPRLRSARTRGLAVTVKNG